MSDVYMAHSVGHRMAEYQTLEHQRLVYSYKHVI
jgi:hypothetical protein